MNRRIVLYSDQSIPENADVDVQLLQLFTAQHPRVAYIPSSSDPNRVWFRSRQAYYQKYGIELTTFFPLDHEYDPAVLPQLLDFDAIHLSGGNTYQFLSALRARSMMQPLREYVDKGGILIGVSAGAILMTPTIQTAALCGDTPDDAMTDLSGLHLVSFAFLPHINHIPHGSEVVHSYVAQHKQSIVACPDGGGVIVQGKSVTLIGGATLYTANQE